MAPSDTPRLIRIHPDDDVAVVANDGGLGAGTEVDGVVLATRVPQAHKVALEDLPAGAAVRRYGVVIGHVREDIAAGGWVNEGNLAMPEPPGLEGLPVAIKMLHERLQANDEIAPLRCELRRQAVADAEHFLHMSFLFVFQWCKAY